MSIYHVSLAQKATYLSGKEIDVTHAKYQVTRILLFNALAGGEHFAATVFYGLLHELSL